MNMAAFLEHVANLADPAVHHVRRRDDIDAGFRLHARLFDEKPRGRIVDHIAAIVEYTVLAMARIGVERDVRQHAEFGKTFLESRTARGTSPAARVASIPSGVLSEGSMAGNREITGTPSSTHCSATDISKSTETRSTPGIDATACRTCVPSSALDNKHGVNQIVGTQAIFAH